jgi:hypothetical protein
MSSRSVLSSPVARYFGNEILSHEMEAADLSR